MPIEEWRDLLQETAVTLIAGLEINLHSTPKYNREMSNSAETVFGAATTLLYRGVDQIYLFNFMDSLTTVDNPADYSPILHRAGMLETAASGVRRHVVTFSDTWAQGEPKGYLLPAMALNKGLGHASAEFRIPIGPAPKKGSAQVFIGLGEEGSMNTAAIEVYINTVCCQPCSVAIPKPIFPIAKKVVGFEVPVELLHNGYNHVRVVGSSDQPQQIVWVEIQISVL